MMTLKLGLEAAGALLFIITSPGIDQRVVNEDAIEASIVLFRHNIANNILPALNNIGHMIVGATADPSNPPSAKKRRRSSSGSGEAAIIREMKKIYKQILSTVGLTVVVMERLESLVQKIPLDDQQVLNLSSGALMSLELDPYADAGIKDAHLLHVATIGVVTSIFRKYSRHRSMIVEDLFPIMLKMPSSKKSLRTFPVQCSSILYPAGLQSLSMSLVPANQDARSMIQTMSAVILTFVQSAVVRPTYETVHAPADDNAMQVEGQPQDEGRVRFMSGLLSCQQLCDMFIMHLLQRCAKKGEDGGASEFRPILSNLIDDLLLILLVPEYPAAEMLLLSIANGLSLDLIKASSSNRALQAAEVTYLNTAFDALGKIGAAEARIRASHQDTPLKLKVSIRNIEDKTVRCYCEKNLHPDTLVLDCDQCHTWYHAPCVDLARGIVPEKWFCDTCQLQRIVGFERDRNTNMGELGFSAAAIDEPYCMRRLLVDYLSIVSKDNAAAGIRDSYEFHLARWVGEVDLTGKKRAEGQPPLDPATMPPLVARLMELWDPSESYGMAVAARGSQSLNGMLQCMSDQGRSRMMLHLAATQSPLLQSFKSQVELIVKLMSSETGSSLRKLAVKAIEKVSSISYFPVLLTRHKLTLSSPLLDHQCRPKADALRFGQECRDSKIL
jgi:cohesin loading factor subunit SCC2